MKIGQEVLLVGEFNTGRIVNATHFDSEGNVEGYVLVDKAYIHELEWYPVSDVCPRYEERQIYIENAMYDRGLRVNIRFDRDFNEMTLDGPFGKSGDYVKLTFSL